jgi:hypothetical protein
MVYVYIYFFFTAMPSTVLGIQGITLCSSLYKPTPHPPTTLLQPKPSHQIFLQGYFYWYKNVSHLTNTEALQSIPLFNSNFLYV